jgi:SIT4 phosphatase-associated protein
LETENLLDSDEELST